MLYCITCIKIPLIQYNTILGPVSGGVGPREGNRKGLIKKLQYKVKKQPKGADSEKLAARK